MVVWGRRSLFLSSRVRSSRGGECQAASSFDRPFSTSSPWNTQIDVEAQFQPTTALDGFIPGLSTFGWAAGGPAIWRATENDPLITLFFHRDGYLNTIYKNGTWQRTNNTAEIEAEIMAGVDQEWLGYEANSYSSQSPTAYVLPDSFKERMDYYWSLEAHVPAIAIPSLDIDGHMAVWQPNGSVLEIYSAIVLSNGDVVAGFVSYTFPCGLGDGYASGRRASMIPNYAGVLRSGELTTGNIRHALAVGLGQWALTAGFVAPATAFDRNASAYAGTLKMGSLLAIPSDVDIDALGLRTNEGRAIAEAAQTFGLYVVDSTPSNEFVIFVDENANDGPGWSFYLESDLRIVLDVLQWS